jgi:hypothetical protein
MLQRFIAMRQAVGQIVTVRIFVAVERLLERAIIRRNQVGIDMRQPVFGVVLPQRPVHNVEALFQDPPARQK